MTAWNSHVGHLQHVVASSSGFTGELRPVCDTCGWKGPKYFEDDSGTARMGLTAHIKNAGSDRKNGTAVYGMRCVTAFSQSRWEFDWFAVDWAREVSANGYSRG